MGFLNYEAAVFETSDASSFGQPTYQKFPDGNLNHRRNRAIIDSLPEIKPDLRRLGFILCGCSALVTLGAGIVIIYTGWGS